MVFVPDEQPNTEQKPGALSLVTVFVREQLKSGLEPFGRG